MPSHVCTNTETEANEETQLRGSEKRHRNSNTHHALIGVVILSSFVKQLTVLQFFTQPLKKDAITPLWITNEENENGTIMLIIIKGGTQWTAQINKAPEGGTQWVTQINKAPVWKINKGATVTWHASKHKVHKLHQGMILHTRSGPRSVSGCTIVKVCSIFCFWSHLAKSCTSALLFGFYLLTGMECVTCNMLSGSLRATGMECVTCNMLSGSQRATGMECVTCSMLSGSLRATGMECVTCSMLSGSLSVTGMEILVRSLPMFLYSRFHRLMSGVSGLGTGSVLRRPVAQSAWGSSSVTAKRTVPVIFCRNMN